jgi:chromosome segregation ATPase
VSFDYDKVAHKDGEHSSWWTSYADLFMMLSIVFLLMYVASSLRAGSNGFQQQSENRRLAQKAEALESEIKVYNTLKDESLRKEQSQKEQEVYNKLMSKLSLLKEEAKDEKNQLRAKAKENEEKEFALNQYQSMIKSIINANVLAKSQIARRDKMIVAKDATIEEKKAKIVEMEQTITHDEEQIRTISAKLDDRIQALRREQKFAHWTKSQLEKKIAAVRQDSARKIQQIERNKEALQEELGEVKETLDTTNQELAQTSQNLQQTSQNLQAKQAENAALAQKLEADKGRYLAEMQGLKAQHDAKLAAERAAFEDGLRKQQLTAAARAKKLADFAADAERKAGELEGKLNGLRGKVAETENKLAGTQNALAGTQAKLQGTEAKLAGTSAALAGTAKALQGTQAKLAGTSAALAGTQSKLAGAEAEKSRALAAVGSLKDDLAKTRAIANARQTLAKALTDQFAKAGMKGNVDGRTGEVTLDFGGEYFDTGSTNLKPKMMMTLDKFIPIYARSLFSDPKLADKIANVEVVGFASSTYKGKYVNPTSTSTGDKEAIEYNLKLSFGRANSIFKHVLNQGKLSDAEREKLLPLMKVVGRGYLPEGKTPADIPTGMPEKDFCAKYNCQKAQKVVVKFNMKD